MKVYTVLNQVRFLFNSDLLLSKNWMDNSFYVIKLRVPNVVDSSNYMRIY